MNDSTNICLSCGLCCDGTLIGFVQLCEEEIPELSKLIEIEAVNGKGFILQPCKEFCNGCTIYAKRPKHCISFKCGLLKSVEQKELGFDLAIETIIAVKQKKGTIEKKLETLQIELQSHSFYFKMVELKKMIRKSKFESSLTKSHLELVTDLMQLDKLLLSKFDLYST